MSKLFQINRKDGTCAKGFYVPDNNSFFVIKDSIIIKGARNGYMIDMNRDALQKIDDNQFKLLKDLSFPSPSFAIRFVCGVNLNGWKTWIDEDGKELSFYYKHN